jgi:hypothetical protein
MGGVLLGAPRARNLVVVALATASQGGADGSSSRGTVPPERLHG